MRRITRAPAPLVSLFALLAACGASGTAPPPAGTAPVAFSDGPQMSAPRATHALVTLPDGRVLAIGGCVRDGCEPGAASATVDVIAADGKRLLGTGQLLVERVQPVAATLPDGRVLIAGGWVERRVTRTTEIYNPATGRSVAGPDMAAPRSTPAILPLADGRVMIAGGYDGRSMRADAQIFDPATDSFTGTIAMTAPRGAATATRLADGRIMLVGGSDSESRERRAVASTEFFDPETGRFEAGPDMAERRYKHGAVALPDGGLLVVGGADERDYGGKLTSVERYDPESGRFEAAGELARPRFKLADSVLLVAPGKVLVAAGDERPELFDIASGTGTLLPYSLDGQWNYMALARLGDGRALLAGGYREGRIVPTDRSWIVRF